ncbi:nickel-dependent hydrogenase large subunit [Methylogaea oryzae]|uniref:Hydrogenase assembly protein HupF n=1 Tax=Methylogaea oryzae TaxID=1295382 RepID=A0A8D4VN68_9GAMM|nr:nickel-dependent hydrogenase large subunit [Methylogaea oryzae]BBL70172.1 hydrogenase assembly protein HupF [Methylogaea oryzae]
MPPSAAGILLRCTVQHGRVAAVELTPHRPYPVAKLLPGRTPAEALRLFAHLFALCPEAHGCAASAAIADALGIEPPPALRAWQECRRRLEIVKENGLYLLRQQPPADPAPAQRLLATHHKLAQAMGGTALYWPTDGAPVIDRAAIGAGLAELEQGLAELCGEFWRTPNADLGSIHRWQAGGDSPAARLLHRYAQAGWADFGRCAVQRLPELPSDALPRHLASADAEASPPIWQGQPRETGSYARWADTALIRAARDRHSNGLYTRALARLAELKALFRGLAAALPSELPALLPPPPRDGGVGAAQTEAPRGRLIHRVALAEGRIRDYRILAPTEWNFHPQGLLPQALLNAPADERLAARIDALLRAVDPCVDFRLRLEHA